MENRNIVFGWFCLFHTKGSTLEPKTNQLFISYGMTVKLYNGFFEFYACNENLQYGQSSKY